MTGDTEGSSRRHLSRRAFLAAGAAVGAGVTLAACGKSRTPAAAPLQTQPTAVPGDLTGAINAAEAARPHTGKTVSATLNPGPVKVDIGGRVVDTLGYTHTVPGPLIRANVGDELSIRVNNKLDKPTSMHWHGIALQNDMDGAMPATPNIPAGASFTYTFSVPDSGTYWAHPHVGVESDTGLYLPIVVDDPKARRLRRRVDRHARRLDQWCRQVPPADLRRSGQGRDGRNGRHRHGGHGWWR